MVNSILGVFLPFMGTDKLKKFERKYSQIEKPVRTVVTQCDGDSHPRSWLISLLEQLGVEYAIPNNKRTWLWISQSDFDNFYEKLKSAKMYNYGASQIHKGNTYY